MKMSRLRLTCDNVCMETGTVGEPPTVRPRWCRLRVVTPVSSATRTQQAHKDLTDINNIVERYQRTGELPPNNRRGVYEDVSVLQGNLTELNERAQRIAKAYQEFLGAVQSKKAKEAAALEDKKFNDEVERRMAAKKPDPPPTGR